MNKDKKWTVEDLLLCRLCARC